MDAGRRRRVKFLRSLYNRVREKPTEGLMSKFLARSCLEANDRFGVGLRISASGENLTKAAGQVSVPRCVLKDDRSWVDFGPTWTLRIKSGEVRYALFRGR